MARAILELIGDADSAIRALNQTSKATKQMGVTAEQTARAQIQAATRRDARLRQEIAVYRQVASAAQKGSREQIAAANLATRAEDRLGRSLAVTSREAKQHARSVASAEREISRFSRGALAGSGVAKALGRSLAFASGGFLATATITGVLRSSIDQGTIAAATQKQLAAQFRESGQDLATYRKQINDTILAVSKLAGFEDDELTRAFTTAFRATRDVNQALTITRVAADAARGAHRDLQSVTLGLTRAWGGAATSLRRLGILIPTTAKGMEAITFVQRRFAGQAAAGTTAQQRFGAALVNTEQVIGLALLPTLTTYLNKGTDWLDQSQNQVKIQRQMTVAVKTTATAVGLLADVFVVAAAAARKYLDVAHALGKAQFGLGTLAKVLLLPGFGLKNLADALSGGGGKGGAKVPGLAGPVGTRGAQTGLVGPLGTPAGPLGFKARFATAELALAQAQLTQTQADDRQLLEAEAKLVADRIKTLGSSRKTLAERTQLTQQLVSIEGQIASIDQAAAQQRKTAADKTLTLRKQQLADEKTRATKELSVLKQRESNLQQQIKSITSAFASAVLTARGSIGDLFGGPVLNFSEEQRKAALGIPNQASDPAAIARDITAQNRDFVRRQRLINRIVRRAPRTFRGLVRSDISNLSLAQLQGIGALNSQQFAALVTRERLARSTARVQMHAQLVTLHADRLRIASVRQQIVHVEVEIKGIDKRQVKVKQSAAQRRGPVPGRH